MKYYISMLTRKGKNIYTCYWYEFNITKKNKTLFNTYNAARETMMIFLRTQEANQYFDVQVVEIRE